MASIMIPHIGQLIANELCRQGRSRAWLAKKINCERSNIYDIVKRESIDTQLLMKISIALNHDFFKSYCDALELKLQNETQP